MCGAIFKQSKKTIKKNNQMKKAIEIIQKRITKLEKEMKTLEPYGNDTTSKIVYYELKDKIKDYNSLIEEIESIEHE